MAGFLVLFAVWYGVAFIFHQLERRAPIMPHYKTGYPRRGYVADIIAAAVNGPGLSGLEKIAYTMIITVVPTMHEVMGHWSWWAQFAAVFLINDFGRYWLHRWYHELGMLWRVHRVHHTIVHMDAMSVFRLHIFEGVIKNGLLFLPFRLLGVDPWVFIVFSAIDISKGYWHHANFRTYIGPLNYIFNSPELHWWHHSVEAKGMMANYGSVLSIWDLMFGTFYWPGTDKWPDKIGVEGMDNFPDDYLGQMLSVRHTDEEVIKRYGAAPAPAESPTAAAVGAVSPAPMSAHAEPRELVAAAGEAK